MSLGAARARSSPLRIVGWLEVDSVVVSRDCDDSSGDTSKAFFLVASSFDIAVLKRSGNVGDNTGRAFDSLWPLGWLSTPSTELHRDLDLRLELERIEERREEGLDRDSSSLTLDDLLELLRGCFFESFRDSLLSIDVSPVRSASSSLSNRFSSSSLSASSLFVARLSFF